jgi:hypothetical protein
LLLSSFLVLTSHFKVSYTILALPSSHITT